MLMERAERARRTEAIAEEAFAVLGAGRQVSSFASRYPGFDLSDAYAVAARVRDMRAARGERAIGRKIGFTNRAVQIAYGVSGPIWNYMFDSTVHDLEAIGGRFDLMGLPEPLIEPEIVLHLAAAPRPDMSDDELIGCVDWVAHGFEIVQSIFPNWRFTAADSVAAYGLHGAYFVGEKRPFADKPRQWADALSSFAVDLLCEDRVVRQGRAANVLGGPLEALRHLVRALDSSAPGDPLRPGELVTTGTLTDAMPVASGQTWSTTLSGIALEGLRLRFD
jgi:2-oxo-3-hexenedioate decarboxylase